ncbi:MAG: glycoside hydrolase family 15 protein [Gammaproteobacteria bacterium]|nr:glycoside hydrolase family 15 protein [Gammaproteobacteria bacterium]
MNLEKLDKHFQQVNDLILDRQDPVTGLLPASTAINAHGDYTDAWIRDNVYCIQAVWGLAMAYRRMAPEHERSYLLTHSVVKLMRGLLLAMMRQADRVETFKHSLNPLDAVHAKFGTNTGLAVVGDEDWGHLQLDAISLYLLMLAQMTASGLRLIFSIDEVNFIQNLVHYISRTYCTPDYGIWERGNKSNRGLTEVNCSSVGMAKAALEALSGFNLFGNISSPAGVIHVESSDPARSRFTLTGLLPRESNSKETDAALLSIIGYPAYAVENRELVEQTRDKIVDSLVGNYGCKRFLLDGHQSALEDESRLHYEPSELQKFRDIESEWPLFFCYLLLDALMRNDLDEARHWREKLEPLFIEHDGYRLLPELYRVPASLIEAEREHPGSQRREPNENLPLTWAQSLFMLADMIEDGVLRPADIDPLRRRQRIGHDRQTPVLIPILAENDEVKFQLRDLGYDCVTLDEIDSVELRHAAELSKIQTLLGRNDKLGLSGRPMGPTRTLTTSRLYDLAGQPVLFLPYFFNPGEFYLSHDNQLLVDQFRSSIRFISDYWDHPGQPILAFLVRSDMLLEQDRHYLLVLLSELTRGMSNGAEVKTGRLVQLMTTASVERIDYLHDYRFEQPALSSVAAETEADEDDSAQRVVENANDRHQIEMATDEALLQLLQDGEQSPDLLRELCRRHGLGCRIEIDQQQTTLAEVCEHRYEQACTRHDWRLVRKMADLLGKVDTRIEDTLLEFIIRQKQLAIGRAYSEKAVISKPHDAHSIVEIMRQFGGKTPGEIILSQEILLHLGMLVKHSPELFENLLTLRVWQFIQLLVAKTGRDHQLTFASAYEKLLSFSPSLILSMLREILGSIGDQVQNMQQQERLLASGIPTNKPILATLNSRNQESVSDWNQWRIENGGLLRLSPEFYTGVWHVLRQCRGIVIGDKYNRGSRLGAEITHDSTAGERSFALLLDSELNNIESPAYRHLNVEMIETLISVMQDNPDLQVDDDLTLDILIGHAVRLNWQKNHSGSYDDQREKAWESFYHQSPDAVRNAGVEAIWHLLTSKQQQSA